MQENWTMDLTNAESRILADEAVKILIEKKGLDIRLYDVREHSSVTDFYINVTGRSTTQVAALADELVYKLELRGAAAYRVEGRKSNSWLLVDYGDVIINVFDRQTREFYNFDRHLPQESLIDITDLVHEVDKKMGFDSN